MSGAFAAAAAVRRRPQHLVSHSARPGLQGLLLLPTYMLCYSAVLLGTYDCTHKLAPPVLHQTRAAALCSTWQHNSQAHTHVSSEACVARCSDLPVSNVNVIWYCTDSTYILVTNIIFNNEVKHFQTEHVLGLSEVLAHVEGSLIGANGRPHPGQRAGCRL